MSSNLTPLTTEEYRTKIDNLIDYRIQLNQKIKIVQRKLIREQKTIPLPIRERRLAHERIMCKYSDYITSSQIRLRKIKILMRRLIKEQEELSEYIPEPFTPEQLQIIIADNNKINLIRNNNIIK
tara:strand:- start:136 stop:510 length:375 start_codon:yes stop_codon:yes gene_type:complete